MCFQNADKMKNIECKQDERVSFQTDSQYSHQCIKNCYANPTAEYSY